MFERGRTMPFNVKRIEYFNATVQDRPGEAYKMLSALSGLGVNLLAFTAIPTGETHTQLSLFPADPQLLAEAAQKTGLVLDGPHAALLVQGDDELGALASIHAKLSEAGVNVFASNGVSDGKGSFGYVVYVRPEAIDAAVAALGL